MQLKQVIRVLLVLITVLSLSALLGCAGKEFAPKDPYMYWYYPKELPEADRALEEARKAGKDKQCPNEFNVAWALKEKAYATYAACRDAEAIAMAKEATAKAKALCPAVAPPPPPPPPAPPPPPPPPPPPAPKVIDRLTIHVNFDFDKSNIRKADEAELKKAIDFIKKYPGAKIALEGHTDSKGKEQYNQKLSERRADAVKEYIIKSGVADRAKISTKGYGETKPIAPNLTKEGKDNPEGRAKNRRVEVLILSD